ncbi:uncharacterized protein isoform X2 [Rhodnius prolixus]|uniref:uncharacterized protein isoform X2 n=1 Tax=Rhodnius prolixus TaxID=13249 RepID=UPI003D18E48F
MEAQTSSGKEDEETVWFESILKNSFRDKEVHRVLSVDLQSAVPEGTNYSSIIQRATLKVILRSGRKSTLTVIVKKSHEVKEKSKLIDDFSLFKAEILMFSKILTNYEQLMDEYQDHNDKLWCTLIGYQPYNLIVFEDLKRENYRVADRTGLLDKLHAQLVLHSLGRFHAMGYVLINKGLVNEGDLRPYYLEVDSPVIQNFIAGSLQQLCNVILSGWPTEWTEIGERLSKQVPVIVEKLRFFVTEKKNSFVTVCHGDCWTCNMMFKYCPYDENIPVSVKFLDFQCPHINSYIFDIIYFLYVSVQPEVRRSHLNELISQYQKSLASTLSLYGIEGKAPTLDHILAEVKRLQYYAMAVNLIYLPITSTEVEKAFTLEGLNEGCCGMDAFNPKIFNTEMFKNSVQSELKRWYNEEIF